MLKIKSQILTGIIISLICILSACTYDEETKSFVESQPAHLIILVGAHKNFNSAEYLNLEYTKSRIEELLVANDGSQMTLISIEGQPKVYASYKFKIADERVDREERERQMQEILNHLNKMRATSNESDLLQALSIAETVLNETSTYNPQIIIIDSGISTAGHVNLLDVQLLEDLTRIESLMDFVDYLEKNSLLPNFKGCETTWLGFGETAGAQMPLSKRDRARLELLWTDILYSSYCDIEIKEIMPKGVEPSVTDEALPFVSAVEVSKEIKTVPVGFSVEFLGDSIKFSDEKKALDALYTLGMKLKKNKKNVLIIGSTANHGSKEVAIALSEARALLVYDILTGFGVDEEQLEIIGLGYDSPFSGYNAEVARNVSIIDKESDLAIEIKNTLQMSKGDE